MIFRELRLEDAEEVERLKSIFDEEGGFKFLGADYVPGEDFAQSLQRISNCKEEETVPEGKVPFTFLVAEIDGKIAGRISIRHRLNDWYALVGGHIGYGVVPEFRGKGIATSILRYGLEFLRVRGIEEAFISCKQTNDASRAVIEKCGGVFAGLVNDPMENLAEYRTYWISTRS
jgi:predicted acetyltransferase